MSKTVLVAWMLGVSVLVVSSQLLLKQHFVRCPLPPRLSLPVAWQAALAALTDLWFWSACLCVLAGALTWMYVLNHAKLSEAYPMSGLVYVLMLLASWGLFHEPVSLRKIVATVAICVGIALL